MKLFVGLWLEHRGSGFSNGFQCLPWPLLITALNVKEVPSFKKHSFTALGVDHLPL